MQSFWLHNNDLHRVYDLADVLEALGLEARRAVWSVEPVRFTDHPVHEEPVFATGDNAPLAATPP